ncbi:PLP-dependent aminotransferase family protein [Aliiruegeria lutimaris]|uniref:Transcriptional regulator, GntR family n=1 Tax=Aliiruegeria lutimaris TaxID=571298 RepID=A0A1G9IXH9_9RHOB|nr:PLP-dependent aminotransferase family protein [Aliiruegeria lutimaris]SDL29937.1 transcriptional regulator, GntR family [Aliiruegeria lutimaris]
MSKSNSEAPWLSVSLDRSLATPLQAQLCDAIRRLVQSGQLESGDRLPPSRGLAEELSVSRITVVTAYDQLVSEGYLVGQRGAGMFVAPDLSALPRPPLETAPEEAPPPSHAPRPFDTGAPDIASFPHRQWAKLLDQVWRAPDPALMSRPDPLGWWPLRAAIARHLGDWRGIRCTPSQIVITSGLGEAVALISETVLSPGDRVGMEEPGHAPLRAALCDCGLQVHPQVVDAEGLDPARLTPGLRAIAVTPSRQFPLGMTLPLARRLRLLQWAAKTGGWILEDDYDGEYRYRGQPLPAMMSLDETGCVIYAGSFSKVLFQGIRLAYLAVPAALGPQLQARIDRRGARAGILAQPVLARFMEEGHFATHLRRMRRLYAHRQRVLLEALANDCPDLLSASEEPSGMHLVARLAPALLKRMNDAEAAQRCREAGLQMRPLSVFFADTPTQQGLVLGFAGFDDDTIRNGVREMARALRS